MLAVLVPKGSGEFRLKALPSPEVLSLQQYVLNELLRDYENCPRFRRLIPGVRFTTCGGKRLLETTGPERFLPVGGETVSFAYTLDMDVIEHRAPPRRTGMFRPYFECWRDFISFIDARVAAFPEGKTFHVARLDVRQFYNTVTRPGVNAVLLDAVKDAMAELADSQEINAQLPCARLFRPDVETPMERAVAIVDWLCDQSFSYEFEPPGTVLEDDPGGLPQGPDLSAYLANISLFPLDRKLSELVATLDRQANEETGEAIREGHPLAVRGAAYARYVDDIVIVARTGNDLARLRSAVEQQLSLMGMELSSKTDPLPVMDETGVREWLTDRRGAGLGVSGPFEGPPGNVPLTLLEPLADAGEADRSDSLRILHDPRLDDPETPSDELEKAIEVILAAPDLRHGDLANVSRHLWCSVFRKLSLGSGDDSVSNAVTEFKDCWSKFKPSQDSGKNSSREEFENVAASNLFAWLLRVSQTCGPRRVNNVDDVTLWGQSSSPRGRTSTGQVVRRSTRSVTDPSRSRLTPPYP
jgi:hypothetical protein